MTNIETIPGVSAIIRKAEEDIQTITGGKIFLAVDAFEVKKQNKAALKTAVCEYFGFTWEEMTAKSRTREMSDAMYVYMFLARREFGCTVQEIAIDCGNRHHSTVVHAVAKINGFYKVGDRLTFDIEAIIKLLKKIK